MCPSNLLLAYWNAVRPHSHRLLITPGVLFLVSVMILIPTAVPSAAHAQSRLPMTVASVVAQQAYLKASNTELDDRFGEAIAFHGDTLVVGAPLEDSSATGVDGDQANNSALDSGAVYVFVREAGVWRQQAYLKASNTGIKDHFGQSVAISGDTLVVGAEDEDSNATGVNGDQENDLAGGSGAA